MLMPKITFRIRHKYIISYISIVFPTRYSEYEACELVCVLLPPEKKRKKRKKIFPTR